MNRPGFRDRLADGEFLLGIWCVLPSPSITRPLAMAGFDFLILDMEHGPMAFETIGHMIVAAHEASSAALVRVRDNSEPLTLNALDLGAEGVVVPHIESVSEAERATRNARYSPRGHRSFSPYTPAAAYSGASPAEYVAKANSCVFVMVIVEGTTGLSALKDIASVDGVDAVYIGTYDISQVLGLPGQTQHPEVGKLVQDSVQKIRAAGKVAGCLAHSPAEMKWMADLGIQLITVIPDCAILSQAAQALRRQFDTALALKGASADGVE